MTDETITVNGVDYPRKDVQAVTLTIPFDAELIEDQPQVVSSFLRARLDEREAVALAARGRTEGRWEQDDPVRAPGRIIDDTGDFVTYDEMAPSEAQGRHIADNDPAFVLAEVDAKRRLMAGHGPGRLVDDSDGKWETDPENWDAPYRLCTGHEWVGYPCETLRLLALPYADHPDYREEWRP